MIDDDLASVLPTLQAHAESRMRDTVLVTVPGEPVWDPVTGTHNPGEPTVVYGPTVGPHFGKARIRNAYPNPQDADAGETMWAKDLVIVSVPVSMTGIDDGMDVEVVEVGPGSASEVGARMTVTAQHFQTDSTARRFPCQVVTRNA
jgi:hypothetical protein